ncbi:OmpA family protein [Ferruginibacter profundus]
MIRKLLILFVFFLPVKNYAQQRSVKYEVRYKQNKYELSNQNKETISTIVDTLQGRHDYIVYINGHTDSDADSSYNQQLSLKRSIEVKRFLIAKGIDETLIKVQAKGEEQPLVANSTPLAKAKNRRVEIIVLFSQIPEEKVIEIKNEIKEPACDGDTTITVEGGYVLTMSKCDWEKNNRCLRVEKRLTYKFNIKENWLKKHIGFKNYKKTISYEPHYEFYVVACSDSCFQNKMKLHIPHYNAQGLNISERYSQKKNNNNQSATLAFKTTKLGDSAYYVADIYCPGTLHCGTDNRCTHNVTLYAKNKIAILSYSYYTWNPFFKKDSIKAVKPLHDKSITDQYRNTFFQTLNILHKGDTIQLKNIPIDVFAHGINRIKTKGSKGDTSYFLFIPYRKRYKCGHFKRYKIRAKDIEQLKQFNLQDVEIEN